ERAQSVVEASIYGDRRRGGRQARACVGARAQLGRGRARDQVVTLPRIARHVVEALACRAANVPIGTADDGDSEGVRLHFGSLDPAPGGPEEGMLQREERPLRRRRAAAQERSQGATVEARPSL